MDEILLKQLNDRNDRIIKAVLAKAEMVCPNSIAFIGITGSFLTGIIHEKSDLDLLIVTNDNDGYKIGSCFIIDDVAFDIYCYTWDRLEKLAMYDEPFVAILLDLKFVYCADDEYIQRYLKLRKKLEKTMASPFNTDDFDKVKKHWDMALQIYANVMMNDNFHTCKYDSYFILYYIEFVIYMLNKSHVKKGVKFIPEEICSMKKLPNHFSQYYFNLLKSDTLDAIKENSTLLMSNVKKYLDEVEYTLTHKKSINSDGIAGSYEEIVSNWKNKMHLAVLNNDAYQSFSTAASCQYFYDTMYNIYKMNKINLMNDFDINDLLVSEQAFNTALEEYKQLYIQTSTKILHYRTVEEFESDYLK